MGQLKSGAEMVWECLLREGVEVVFGYPGGQILPIYDALHKYHHRIHHVLARHEQGATHMADGYARVSGRVGVTMATSGPGATNVVTGLLTAMRDASPLVCVTGQVPSAVLGSDAFQEVDISGVSLPVTKHGYVVTDINDLVATMREAFSIASQGRPGPVVVDVCKDVQNARIEFEGFSGSCEQPVWRRAKHDLEPDPAGGESATVGAPDGRPARSRASLAARLMGQIMAGQALIVTDRTPDDDDEEGAVLSAGTPGFGLPAAIGASFHVKDRPVWAVVGDGSMQRALKELGAAVQEQVKLNICVVSDGGQDRAGQEWASYGPMPFPSPDYVKLALAYGLPGYRARSLAELVTAMRRAEAQPGPALVEWVVEPFDAGDPLLELALKQIEAN